MRRAQRTRRGGAGPRGSLRRGPRPAGVKIGDRPRKPEPRKIGVCPHGRRERAGLPATALC
jgi:hypothetical protein